MKNFIKKMDFWDRFMAIYFLIFFSLAIVFGFWVVSISQFTFFLWFLLVVFHKQRAKEAEDFSNMLWDWMLKHSREAKRSGKRAYLTINEKAACFSIEAE